MKTASVEYSRKSPNTIIALLHPGTTDTGLSKPFQRGGTARKALPCRAHHFAVDGGDWGARGLPIAESSLTGMVVGCLGRELRSEGAREGG